MIVLCEIGIIAGIYYLSRRLPTYKFEKVYEQEIIKPIVESYNNEIIYDLEKGISKEEYSLTGYPAGDKYYTGNYFENRDASIRSSNITILDKTTDEDGHTEYRTRFAGIFSIITLKNFSKDVITMSIDSDIINRIFQRKNKIEVDSAEFEKNFDLYCENRVYAMEIFTADLLEKILDICENDNTKFDIKLNGNKLYVRYYRSTIFKVDLNKSMKKETMQKMYRNTHKLLDLLNVLKENIDKKIEDVN